MKRFPDDFLWQVYVNGILNQNVKKGVRNRTMILKTAGIYKKNRTYISSEKIRLKIIGKTKKQIQQENKNVYITPIGNFICVREAGAALNIHWQKVRGRCMYNTKKISKCTIMRSELTDKDFGKTYKELGYDFIDRISYYPL